MFAHPNNIKSNKRTKIQKTMLRPSNECMNQVSMGHVINSTDGTFSDPIRMMGSHAIECQFVIERNTMLSDSVELKIP